MRCPMCGFADTDDPVCPGCGVVFAKLRGPRPDRPPRPYRPVRPPPPKRGFGGILWLVLGLVAVACAAFWLYRLGASSARPTAPQPGPTTPVATAEPATQPAPAAETPKSVASGLTPPPAPDGRLSEQDVVRANALTSHLERRLPVGPSQRATAEELYARYPQEPTLARLMQGTLMALAAQEQQVRNFAPADELLLRAILVDPGYIAPRRQLVQLRLSASDWAGAEAAVREILDRDPNDADAWLSLAFALFRQDRQREAVDAVERSLSIREHPEARALLARLEKTAGDEAGMREQQLAYFNVRYDGEEHAAVGRAVLRALERHYATLVRTFDHRPQAAIPVTLFSRQAYFDASGAPAWSGGAYDAIDGKIRIPIAGLTESLTPDMDETLIHELTHAFVFSMSRGVAPRTIHEGLAQYMEGKRIDRLLNREQLQALAQGRARGVSGFYIEALGFVEFLVSQRSMGGMKDLLESMAASGDADAAYRSVHGKPQAEMEQAWRKYLQRRYGR